MGMSRRAQRPRDVELVTLAARLAEVRASGKRCFGCEAHRFELAPPVALAEVLAFERARKRTLPDSYRRFVLEVGASGAGPFHGLLPLARWKDGLRVARTLKIPAITLTDQGCDNYSLLVIDGPRRGRVVYVSDTGTAYYPADRDFAAWYRRWLDEILWDYHNTWFGHGMPGREPDFLAALTSSSLARRVDGAAAMARLPSLTGPSRDALVSAIRTDRPRVVCAAIRSLARHDRTALEPLLPALLASRYKPVVTAALDHVERSPLANELATAKDPDVARRAIHAGTLDERQLVALLDGPAWEEALTSLRQRQDGHATPRLIEMIDDPDRRRRLAAIVCLRSRRDAVARDALHARLAREPEADLRAQLVEALGAAGDLDAVIEVARHGEPQLRFRAAYVLALYGDARAIPVLTDLTSNTERPPAAAFTIGEQARRALARLAAPDREP
jgi:hypothetical protein